MNFNAVNETTTERQRSEERSHDGRGRLHRRAKGQEPQVRLRPAGHDAVRRGLELPAVRRHLPQRGEDAGQPEPAAEPGGRASAAGGGVVG